MAKHFINLTTIVILTVFTLYFTLCAAQIADNQSIEGLNVTEGPDHDINDLDDQRFYEGDILIPKNVKGNKNINRYITKSQGKHWPNGQIPYSIDHNFDYEQKKLIDSAFEFFERNTCLRWVKKRANEKYWVSINGSDLGCYSRGIGRTNRGANIINLSRGCFTRRTVIHELMHRIGFIHEQSRPDRDKYIHIFYENIKRGQISQFRKRPELFSYEYGLPYDIYSAMHYKETSFGINRQTTIIAKNGQKLSCDTNGMECPTKLDIKKINVVYDCKNNNNNNNGNKNKSRFKLKLKDLFLRFKELLKGL